MVALNTSPLSREIERYCITVSAANYSIADIPCQANPAVFVRQLRHLGRLPRKNSANHLTDPNLHVILAAETVMQKFHVTLVTAFPSAASLLFHSRRIQ
jgi:hypothetical protein